MKIVLMISFGLLVFISVHSVGLAQEGRGENADVPSILDENEDEFSGDEDSEDSGEDENGSSSEPLNESEALRLQRLVEASGKTEQEILDLRNGVSLDGEPVSGQRRGWGQVAKMLGLHPGVLGHGTGDKFYPPQENGSDEDNENLPELPSLEGEADAAAASARERSGKRKSKGIKQNFGPEDSQADRRQMRRLKRESGDRKVRSARKGRPDKPGRPDNGKKGETNRPKK